MEDLTLPREKDTLVEDLTAAPAAGDIPSEKSLQNKVNQAMLAMPEKDPAELSALFSSGKEDSVRVELVSKVNERKQQAARKLVYDMSQRGNDYGMELYAAAAEVDPAKPDAILETESVNNALDLVVATSKNPKLMEQASSWDGFLSDPWAKLAIKEQVALNKQRKYNDRWKSLGYGEWLVSGAVDVFAGFTSWYNLARETGSGLENDAYLKGASIRSKAENLWQLEPDEFAKALDKEMEELWYNNPHIAMQFLDYVMNPSESKARFDNIIGLFDIPLTGAVAKGAAKAGKAVKFAKPSAAALEVTKAPDLVKLAADVAPVLGKEGVEVPHVLNAAGATDEAAEFLAIEEVKRSELAKKFAPGASKRKQAEMQQLVKFMPDMYNPQVRYSGADTFANKRALEIAELAKKNIDNASKIFRAIGRQATLTDEAMQKAIANATDELARRIPTFIDRVHEIRTIAPEDNLGAGEIVAQLGKPEGAFKSAEDALQSATQELRLAEGSFRIEQQGGNYWIEVFQDVSETGEGIDDLLINAVNTSRNTDRPFSWLQSYLSSAKETVSEFQASERGVAVSAVTRIEAATKELMRPQLDFFQNASKQRIKEFDSILALGRDTERIPGDPTTMGKWFKNIGELSEAYMVNIRRLPTQAEVDAYFNFTMVSDLDWAVRSVALAKSKVKRGISGWDVDAYNLEGVKTKLYLEGTPVDKFPDSRNISFVEVRKDGSNISNNFNKLGETRKVYEKKFAKGEIKVIRLADAENSLVPVLGNEADRVAYVILHDAKQTPIRMDKQLNYNPGGHVVYEQKWRVAQPVVKDGQYLGDETLIAASTKAEAVRHQNAIGRAIDMYKAKDANFESFLRGNLPWTPEEFAELLKKGKIRGDAPVAAVRMGEYTASAGMKFHNGKDWVSQFGQLDDVNIRAYEDTYKGANDFTQSRLGPLKQIRKGGAGDPLWRLENADRMNPRAAQAQTMNRLVHNAVYEDYQFQAARSWIEEFGNSKNPASVGLKVDGEFVPIEKLRKNPLYYLNNAEIVTDSVMRKGQAEQIRSHIRRLVSNPDIVARGIAVVKEQFIADYLYKYGLDKQAKYMSEKEIPFISDPLQFMKNVAFHTKLGLFNPVQFFLQSTAGLNSIAFSPVNAMKAAPASWYARMSLLTENDKIISSLAEKAAQTSGYDAAAFKDARYWLREFGLDIVGREQTYISDVSTPKPFYTKTGEVFLDKGTMFFSEGERIARIQSWMTSYLDYVAKNPKSSGKLTLKEAKIVRNRAEMMYGNMTRDANAYWQTGLLGNFTQFYTYNARMVELMLPWTKQTTMAEKARLFGMFATLWGIPIMAAPAMLAETGDVDAAMSGVFPFGQDIAQEALKKGYNLHEGMTGLLYDGLVNTTAAFITGKDYDFSSRYGLNPFTIPENIENTVRKYGVLEGIALSALGASGSIGADIVSSVIPITKDLAQMAGETGSTELLYNDIQQATREISTLNYGYQVMAALMGTTYVSKNGTILRKPDDDPLGRVIASTIGVTEMEDFDTSKRFEVLAKDAASRKAVEKRIKELRSYQIIYRDKKDYESAKNIGKQIEALINSGIWTPSEKRRMLQYNENELSNEVLKQFEKRY